MNNYIFEKIDTSYGTMSPEEVIYDYGVNYDCLEENEKSLFNIAWHGWTVKEIQTIIDNAKKIINKEVYDYTVPGSELAISVDKDYVYFFDWRTSEEEEEFSWEFVKFINFMEAFKIFVRDNE